MKKDLKRKLISLLLIAIMLCSISTSAVTADTNKDATSTNTAIALSDPSPNTGNTGYEPWYYYAGGGIVNSANGNLYFPEEDISIKARGFYIQIIRSYNSHNSGKHGPFGFGWTFNYNTYLVKNKDGSVTYFDEDGSAHTFTPAGGNNYTAPSGIHSKLTKNPDDSFVLWFTDGSKYNFGSNGKIINITDKNGNHLNFTYNILRRLTRISDDSGLYLDINYNLHGRISSVVDPIGRQINYEYEAADLVKVTDAMGNSSLYQYYDDHKLKSKVDRVDNMLLFSYTDNDMVKAVKVTLYNQTTKSTDPYVTSFTLYSFKYDNTSNIAYVTDGKGYITSIKVNSNGNPKKITDPLGGVTMMNWDSDMNLISFTDANGHITSYEYGAYGNLIKETDPLGGSMLYEYSNSDTDANYLSLLTKVTNARGIITSYEYDTKGNLIKITDATGNVSFNYYDNHGNLINTTDYRDYTTFFAYNTHGYLINSTDATGNITKYSYDNVGRQVNITDANGHSTKYEYDNNDNLVKLIDPLGNEIKYEYDAQGILINKIDANGHKTSYGNGADRIIDASSKETTFSFDENGNLIKVTDAKNSNTTMNYDPLGRVISVTDALGNTKHYSYDAVGNQLSSTDENGNTVTFTYDALNRLVKVKDASGYMVEYSYDAIGNFIYVQDTTGYSANYVYDELSRLISATVNYGPFTKTIIYTYDANGNRKTIKYPDEGIVTYQYDAVNRLVSITAPFGNIITFKYDNIGRRTEVKHPNGIITTHTYDSSNRLLNLTNRKSNGEMISSYSYTYDNAGNRLSMGEADGNITQYEYDEVYRLTKVIYPYGEALQYVYDVVGNRLSKVNSTSTISYIYDADNRLLTAGTTAYSYNNNGNLIRKIESGETTLYEYDCENRLTKVILPDGEQVAYKYAPTGERLSRTDSSGTTYYLIDFEDVIAELDENGARKVRNIHGPKIDEPIGMLRDGTTLYYHFDGLGSVTSLTDTNGNVVASYKYDVFGAVIKETGEVVNQYKFTSREFNEDTGLYYYRTRYYDADVGRFLSKDPLWKINKQKLYTYVDNNPVNLVDPTGLIDSEWWWNFGKAFVTNTPSIVAEQAVATGKFWKEAWQGGIAWETFGTPTPGTAAEQAGRWGGKGWQRAVQYIEGGALVTEVALGAGVLAWGNAKFVGGTSNDWFGLVRTVPGRSGNIFHIGRHPLPMRDLTRIFGRKMAGQLRRTPFIHLKFGEAGRHFILRELLKKGGLWAGMTGLPLLLSGDGRKGGVIERGDEDGRRRPGGDHPDDSYDVSTLSCSTSTSNTDPHQGYDPDTQVAILARGSYTNFLNLLDKLGESSTFVDVDSPIGELNDYPVLIIPSGGLYGMDSLPSFKSKLEQYVSNGGTLIVFSQQHGYEFDAAPGDLGGYGWTEDQSCHYRSVGISTYHPILSGQDSVTSDVNVDGYFTKYPENATILLSRTKNGMPAMLMYEYGNGTVIATTIYTDWAYSHYQATRDGKRLVRDMITWAKNSKELPEYGAGDSINIPINITSYIDLTANKVKFTVIDPDKKVVDTVNVTTSILPFETKTVNFTDTAPSKLGIWHIDYSLINDSYGEVQCMHDTQKFAVSKYAENPNGFVYHGKDITFTISSPEEQYAYGSDVPFTIHIWNKGDTARNISFSTYYKDWWLSTKLPEQNVEGTLNVSAGGDASFTHILHVGDIYFSHNQLIIYASFSEDGSSLGRTEKVVYMFRPSVSVDVETDKQEYAIGEDVSSLLNLINKRSSSCNATIIVKTLDQDNKKIFEDSFDVHLSAFASENKTLNFTLPIDSKYGIYIVTAEAYSKGNKIGSDSTYFKVSRDYIVKVKFDSPNKLYRIRENINMDLEVTNLGSTPWSSTVNVSIPAIGFNDSRDFTLNPNETEKVNYNPNIPETTPAGKHDVIVTISYDNSTKEDCFFIPKSDLILSSDKSSYNAGENLSINLTNIGGVDTIFNCSVKFSDRKSFVIYENDTQGNISVGENRTISFEIPDQAVNGIYHLIASCKDLKTNKTTMLSKSYEISGLKVFLTTSTNRRIYFKNETIRALTNITNLDGSIENATLNLRVYSGMYRAAPEVTTNFLDGRLEINNTFIDAVVNSGSDFDSSGPTTLGQNTQTRYKYKHPTKIESTEQKNRNSIMPMAVFDGDIGRFTVGTTGGDPENPDDDYEELMYGHPRPWSSFTTIRVDGKDYIYGSFDGNFTSLPHFEDSSIVSDWEIEDVVVTQKLTIVYSSTGNPDALEIKYSIVNKNETSKDVGGRVMIDTQLAGNDGAPFTIPDVGNVTKEREFIGADVPLWWTTMDSLTDPSIIAHGTLRGVGSDPDKFVISRWWDVLDTTWDYEVDPDEWITDDSAIGIWWNPISLSAEQSREVATFYGIGYVSEVGGVVVWEEEMPLSIAEEEEADISTNITLNTTGKFSLVSTLFSNTSQIIDQNKSYFYIIEENTSLTLETDKLVYKPNEEVTISGEVTNYAVIADDYNLSIEVNGEEIFSDSFSLGSDQTYSFTTTTRQNNSFILEGTVNEVTITDFIRIEHPSVNVFIIAPDVVGLADFDVGVLIENIGNIAADLVVNINSTWNITVPEGESRLLETTKNITENTTLNVIISGDVNKTIQKEITFGENAEINITPEDTYLEGTVEIPFVITNIGLLDTEFNATFSISSDEQTISRRFFVPKGENISDSVSFNLTKGAHLLRYNSPFEEVNVTVNVLSPPEFVVTSILPADMNFTIGENITLVFKVKNIGGSEGEATLRLLMPDFEDTNRTWVRAGAEENISFNLTIPDDLEEKNYKGIYELDGKRDEFTFFVQGANISVDASLDKPLYEEGETAILTLNVNNERNIDLSLYSRVKFNEYDGVQNFTLPGSGSETLEFNVPVQFTGDNKMLYTVYMDSGRALYINSIYVYEKKPDVPLRLYTDKDVYNMGEDVTIHIVDVTKTDLLNLTAPSYTYNDTISGPTTLEFTLPELRSGTYYIDYTFGNFSSSLPFDVIGYFVRILEAGLDKEEYISGDDVKLRMNIETNRNVSGLLKTWIYDPEDELIDEFEMNRTLMEGENEIEISRILLTNISGIHVIVYGFYADLSGHSLTSLVSGAEYFDASPPLDTEPPIISNVRATNITTTSATITWDTDEVSNSLVKYGTESGNYTKQEYDATNVTSHTINLVGLNANTTYYYVVNSTDTSNNSNQSIEHSFTTLTPPNLPPVANANGPYTGIVGEPITFNGTGSYDPDGTIVSYEWDLDDDGEFGDAIGPTPSKTWNIPYSGTISLKVTDDDGEVGTDTTIITVLAAYDIAYDLKEDAITDLKAINTTDKHAQKDIDKAIQHINKSLEGSLWNGTTRLDPKHGHKVFDEEKKAVKHLMKITEEKGKHEDPAIVDEVKVVIDKLTKADEQLAIVAINDAKNTSVQDPKKQDKVEKEIAKAEEELAKAYQELAKGKPDKAIDHYKKAWEHAQQAIKHAQNPPKK